MENLKKLEPTKELWVKIKWILSYSNPVIPFLIFNIIFNIIFALIGIYNVIVSKSLIDAAISHNSQEVIKWLIIMCTLTIISILSAPIRSFMSTHSSTKLNHSIQKQIYEHIEYSNWLEISKIHSVSLLTRITSDVSNISSTLITTIPSIVSLAVTLIGSVYTLINWAPSIAIVALFIGPFLVIIGKLFSRKLMILYKEAQEEDVKYKAFMQESIQNIMIIKTFCMENINMKKLNDIQDNKYRIAMRNTKYSSLTSLSMSFCSSLAYFSIFTWGVLNISKGVTTYGTFTGMLQLYNKVQSPFSSLASMIPGLISTIAAAERLIEIENISLESKSSINISNDFNKPTIEFNNVSFSYNSNTKILNNINLKMVHGETIGFIGPSGEGKTTLIRLILSLITPSSGNIYLRENDINKKLHPIHRNLISYVPQGNTLFSGTIEDNLRYGNPNATEEDIREALKNACALDFVEKLDNGIKSVIGEKGVGISEGQSQRLSIARAFLRQRPILILDEATSSLDPETEIKVLRSISSLPNRATCIIITHRPSALNICDRILKLNNKSLTEIDKYEVLEIASELI
ncbi:ABC transporter ATP-binding protein [Clostridium sp. NSJ-49]|uniref:ABC transporter ATP-binding protein n=1 Tax=Clostridium TaxID=1485 RepID=UPI00164C1239|nr:ABC transporter ATP-binding protein [Clostridium sp. NSJ-49]MBC5624049.1 ABC transporter ATP-binding protein [Clostridium sp. NSJ-49]